MTEAASPYRMRPMSHHVEANGLSKSISTRQDDILAVMTDPILVSETRCTVLSMMFGVFCEAI